MNPEDSSQSTLPLPLPLPRPSHLAPQPRPSPTAQPIDHPLQQQPLQQTPSSSSGLSKRKNVSTACAWCRKRKERCDGRRPVCGPCEKRKLSCAYAVVGGDPFRITPLRRSFEAFQNENQQWRELFNIIQKLPHVEAAHTLSQIRSSQNPVSVLNFAKCAALASAPAPGFSYFPTERNPKVDVINMRALIASPIKVNARPWTVVAGDGIVSELISSFFMWDGAFYHPFITLSAFLADMKSNNPKTAKYCSPFLVNIICATRHYASPGVKSFSQATGKDLGLEFINEAKRQLELENGRSSLPSVQGLALMFHVSAHQGTDRAGMMYRYAAYEMLQRMNLERTFEMIKDKPERRLHKSVISRVIWGLFCYESITAYIYLEPSLLPPPTIEQDFYPDDDQIQLSSSGLPANIDVLGNIHKEDGVSPPFVPGLLKATCDLSEFLYASMTRNAQQTTFGSEADMAERRRAYAQVLSWWLHLSPHLRNDRNLTPQTSHLRSYLIVVLTSIIRPLPPDMVLVGEMPARELLIGCAASDVAVVEKYAQKFGIKDYSSFVICGVYNAVVTLVPHLRDVRSQGIFTRAALILRLIARDIPMTKFVLQGIKALTWAMQMPMPREALQYFEDLGDDKEGVLDLPIDIALPDTGAVRKMLGNSGRGEGKTSLDMGKLISKWSTMSLS